MTIFSGDNSIPIWNFINRFDGRTHSMLYSAGCHLQEIEAWVRRGCRRGRVECVCFEVEDENKKFDNST